MRPKFSRRRRIDEQASPRYYLYVSDAKVDMLYAQIPRSFLNRIAAELRVDLKVIGVKLSERRDEETRYSKLRVVDAYVRNYLPVGTIDEPEEYFEGAMPMSWGLVANRLAYFAAETEQTVFGLGGSPAHVISAAAAPTLSEMPSTLFGILSAFGQSSESPPDPDSSEIADDDDLFWIRAAVQPGGVADFGGVVQPVDFLAKRLRLTTDDRLKPPNVLVGSPIYVALAE